MKDTFFIFNPLVLLMLAGALLLIIVLVKATYIVRQSEMLIIERLGKFHTVLDSGIHFIVPFFDYPRSSVWTFIINHKGDFQRLVHRIERIDMREAVYDFPKQNVITKDNVTIEINALLYYQITDPKSAIYEVANLPEAIEKLTQTTLRNVIGSLDLDETLSSRDQINEKLRIILDEATDKWGVKVNRVELQEINPPYDIRIAMEKQMRAERDRRALILEAEGKKRAAILTAEGEQEAQIARASGGAKARLILAEAEAEAIRVVKKAAPESNPLPYLVAQNYVKALPEMLKDHHGKVIVVPYETSGVLGSLQTIKELFNHQGVAESKPSNNSQSAQSAKKKES